MPKTAKHQSPPRRVRKLFASAVVFACFLMFWGFTGFVNEIRNTGYSGKLPEADGVVVLTGGAKRLEAAVSLFEASYGQRLLISGVGRGTTRGDLGRLLDRSDMMFGCCVDIDRKALDTRGNAKYTARWAKLNNFSRLLIVTSSYHMPRSLMLMKRRMPDVELIAVPIRSPKIREQSFWKTAMSPVVVTEYAKYLIARMGIEPAANSFRSAFRMRPADRT